MSIMADQYLWMKILGGFRLVMDVGSFHELAVDECRAGTHERDQVHGVHRPPAVLRGLELSGGGTDSSRHGRWVLDGRQCRHPIGLS